MGFFSSHEDVAAKLAVIERKLDAIISQLGIQYPDGSHADVDALAKAGKYIDAIKLYREKTGADLASAKAFVDSMR